MTERINNGNEKLMAATLLALFDPHLLHQKFDNYINSALGKNEDIRTSFGITLPKLPNGLTKDKMQQEMYTMGYKRVTKNMELSELPAKFHISNMDLNWLRSEDVHTRFFIQSFPRSGENNLVAFLTIDDQPGFMRFMACASRDYINMNVAFKSAIDFRKATA